MDVKFAKLIRNDTGLPVYINPGHVVCVFADSENAKLSIVRLADIGSMAIRGTVSDVMHDLSTAKTFYPKERTYGPHATKTPDQPSHQEQGQRSACC